MALSDTGAAIGAVSRMLQDRLGDVTGNVIVGRPEEASASGTSTLNLFLYEIQFDPGLRDVPLDEGQSPPLWLILKYLLTAFDVLENSDSIEAHNLLGEGMRVLQDQSFLSGVSSIPALQDNPETLKLKFDEVSSDLLSKLMQGAEDNYRCSVGFEVRPVMLASAEAPSYSLLVGIDYRAGGTIIREEGVHIPVIPSMGPTISRIEPKAFEPGDTITIHGDHLDLANLSVRLGPVEVPVIAQTSQSSQCRVNGTISNGDEISADSHPLRVVQTLSSGRRRSSNILIAGLRPVLHEATPVSMSCVSSTEPNVFGDIDLSGVLLGTDEDDTYVALYLDGTTIRLFDNFVDSDLLPEDTIPQTRRRLHMREEDAVPAGIYRVILRVNGQQARYSPEIELRAAS